MNGRTCPHCGRHNDVSTPTEGHGRPRGGDVTICWKCKGIAVFVETPLGLVLRIPTEEERAAVGAEPKVRRALAALHESYQPDEALALLRSDSVTRARKSTGGVAPGLVREVLAKVRADPQLERLPCGCEMGTVGDAFVMRPCSPDCKYWRYAKAEAERQGKPLGLAYDGDVN